MIAGIILAAGSSRRFGAPKLLCEVHGRPLLGGCLAAALASRIAEIRVVVPASPPALAQWVRGIAAKEPRLLVDENPHPERGMMSSLKVGIRSLASRASAAVVILGDMPATRPRLIDELVDAHEKTGAIVVPECRGVRGHPRVIPVRFFAEFLALPDDAKGTAVTDRHPEDVFAVSTGSPDEYIDVDMPEDLDAYRRVASRRDPHDAGGTPSRS